MKRIVFFLILIMCSTLSKAQRERTLQIDSDTLTRPTSPLYGLAVIDDTLYLVPATGNMIKVGFLPEIEISDVNGLTAALDLKASLSNPKFTSQLSVSDGFDSIMVDHRNIKFTKGSNYINPVSNNSQFLNIGDFGSSKKWNQIVLDGTSVYLRQQPDYKLLKTTSLGSIQAANAADITGVLGYIPISSSGWVTNWDSVKNSTGIHEFSGRIYADDLRSEGSTNVMGDFYVGGEAEFEGGIYLYNPYFYLPSGNGRTGMFLKNIDSGEFAWGEIIDTLGNRPVLPLSPQAAALIPDSSHLVIESDFIKARSSGNAFFDTLRIDYSYYNLLRDSIELVLPDFDTLQETYFHVTFFGSDDADSLFKYVVDTVLYNNYVYNDTAKIDSLPTNYISSILYFSEPVHFYSESSNATYASNYMSSDHHRTPFRLPNKNSPIKSFNLIWKPEHHKYYIK